MFEAEMSSDAWLVAGMADKAIIPKVSTAINPSSLTVQKAPYVSHSYSSAC
jgi:hypothetical protein